MIESNCRKLQFIDGKLQERKTAPGGGAVHSGAVVSKRELATNLKTARELGMTMPVELVMRADNLME